MYVCEYVIILWKSKGMQYNFGQLLEEEFKMHPVRGAVNEMLGDGDRKMDVITACGSSENLDPNSSVSVLACESYQVLLKDMVASYSEYKSCCCHKESKALLTNLFMEMQKKLFRLKWNP
ncbi:hypothetical protein IFM89_004032 [Coptis chinensis]|uniref:Uncharacterized protein n=1 Tax=Coptis chinensis TaxID=261450 RepID=A0A835LDA3_9MAGN|nr:hypothetical protein IFM89_004032 [Coptis chinensis]